LEFPATELSKIKLKTFFLSTPKKVHCSRAKARASAHSQIQIVMYSKIGRISINIFHARTRNAHNTPRTETNNR